MQDVVTATVVLAGLFFSITCALLVEELMFGLFFRALTLTRRARTHEGAGATKAISTPEKQPWAIPISQQRQERGGLSCSH